MNKRAWNSLTSMELSHHKYYKFQLFDESKYLL